MGKKKYLIELKGCDDSTLVILELNVEEIKILKQIKRAINKQSFYQCQPTMKVVVATKKDEKDLKQFLEDHECYE